MTLHELKLRAAKARLLGLEMVYTAASGHIGGSLSAMDILTELYGEVLRVDPADPRNPGRDRFVMSKGHCTPGLYPSLALAGFFPVEDLKLFRLALSENVGKIVRLGMGLLGIEVPERM